MLFHITTANAWERAQTTGALRPASLTTEGFVHCSTRAQVAGTWDRFFRGQTDLVLLVLDAAKIEHEIRYEQADGQLFPHVYGPLNRDAVMGVLPLAPNKDGAVALPEDL